MAVVTTNLGTVTAYGDAVAAGYTGTKAEWQSLMASYATVGQTAVDAKDVAVQEAAEAVAASNVATQKASEASNSAQSIAQSAAQIQENTDDISQLNGDLSKYGCVDVLASNATYTNRTYNGITFTWNSAHTECTISGTASGTAFDNLYHDMTALMNGIVEGETYHFKFKTTDRNINLRIIWYDSNGDYSAFATPYFKGDGDFTVPIGAVGMTVRFHIGTGYTISGKAFDIAILNTKSNKEIEEQLYSGSNVDLLPLFDVLEESKTRNGVTFTWDDAHKVCTVSGTSTGVAFSLLYNNTYLMPYGVVADGVYRVDFVTNTNAIIEILYYKSDRSYVAEYCYSSKWVHIPTGTVGMIIRIRVFNNVTANGTVSNIHFYRMAQNPINPPLMFTVVDDDTSSTEFCRKFFQNCSHNGIMGDYAVTTKMLDDGVTSANDLKEYEEKGFGILTHCYYQSGSQTPWWSTDADDYPNKMQDIVKCLRSMRDYGFINYDFWMAPSGLHNDVMQKIARQVGFKCIAGAGFNNYNSMNIDRYYIQRTSLGENDTGSNSVSGVKSKIDACVANGGGWLIIMTHFNVWESENAWDSTEDADGYEVGYSRFNEVVQYALSNGMKNVTFAEGFSYIEPNIVN